MKKIQLKQIGSFIKTHGFQGDLVLSINEEISSDLLDKSLIEKEAVFVEIDGIPVPFFIAEDGIRELNPITLLIKFDDVDEKKAKQICTNKVFINTYYLNDIEGNKELDPSALKGFLVTDEQLGEIGLVKDFIDLKENPLLSVDYKGKDVLLPILADFILSINDKTKVIETNLPDGFLEALL
jgi:16S rRNA processing protein RimM